MDLTFFHDVVRIYKDKTQQRILPFLKGEVMTLEYAVCPHCGCRCEDDEYCAACGKLFHEDTVPARKVSFLGLLGNGVRSISKNFRSNVQDNGENDFSLDQDSDLDFDASWSSLSSNLYNRHNLK